MATTKAGPKLIMSAAVAALVAVVAAVVLLRTISNRHASTPSDTHQPLLAKAMLPPSPTSLDRWNVLILCPPAERGPLAEAVSSRGARVQSALGVETDLVIVGTGAGISDYADLRQEANDLRIPVLDHIRLATFRPFVGP